MLLYNLFQIIDTSYKFITWNNITIFKIVSSDWKFNLCWKNSFENVKMYSKWKKFQRQGKTEQIFQNQF